MREEEMVFMNDEKMVIQRALELQRQTNEQKDKEFLSWCEDKAKAKREAKMKANAKVSLSHILNCSSI
jgi:hypothetical protein